MPITPPFFETVAIPQDRSLLVFDRRLPEFPFNWHYHPEFELTLTVGSRGMRFVGDDVGQYDDGDLVLIAPNVPHAFQSQELLRGASEHRAVVWWFAQGWVEGLILLVPELSQVAGLLAEARRGLRFDSETSARLRARILSLSALAPLAQVMSMQGLLAELAASDRMPLASGEVLVSNLPHDRLRLQKVLDHLHANYDQPLRLRPICDLVHLTESQLQRVFKRSTRMSITAYVAQLRLGRACHMLAQTEAPIGQIAQDSGFPDAAEFARRFRQARGVTPTAYRNAFRGGLRLLSRGDSSVKRRARHTYGFVEVRN